MKNIWPSTVKIAWLEYDIVPMDAHEITESHAYGTENTARQELKIDIGASSARQAHTILHELFHAAAATILPHGFWNPKDRTEKEYEEQMTSAFADVESLLMRDNPELYKTIREALCEQIDPPGVGG